VEETMDSWTASGTALKINCVNLQIPSFGKFKVYFVHYGPLEKGINE
jgi:hypothetical protein